LSSTAVKVLGWGQNENSKYWIVEGSWGSSWGQNGYAYYFINFRFVDLEDNSLNINSYSFSIIPNYQKKNYDERTILN
jgi:hypothetical protein